MSQAPAVLEQDLSSRESRLEAVLENVRGRRGEIERGRCVPRDIVDGLVSAGLYRATVPQRFGGDGRPLSVSLRQIERISAVDPSVGWVASFAPQGANYFGALSPDRLAEIYADGPDVVGAGGLFPLQPAERVPGGLRINGRWKFGSGSLAADWISVGVIVPGDEGATPPPRLIVLPAEKVDIVPNWETVGLSGTGSHDLVVRDVVMAEDWSFVRGGAPQSDDVICRFPAMALAACAFAVVGLGAARGALDAAIDVAAGKTSITGGPRLADKAYVQHAIAKAEAALGAARAFLYEQVDGAWAAVEAGREVSPRDRMALRLAANHASRAGVEVAQAAFATVGTTAIFLDNPIQQFLRDALVVNQHAFLGEANYEAGGRMLLGLPPSPGFP
ncbi:acyl-CoA dehydrogenase family protein [Sphingomonas sp. YL-JM2C]